MQIQAINNRNKQTNFGAVYQPSNVKWNKLQKPIVSSIQKALREPLQKFNGQTAEGFYKSNKNIDFMLESDTNNSVLVRGLKNVRSKIIGTEEIIQEESSFRIGSYDNYNNSFHVDDIEKSYKEDKRDNILSTANFLIVGLCIALVALNGPITKAIHKSKPSVESVDSISNKTKTVLSDTIKTVPKILKPIKK